MSWWKASCLLLALVLPSGVYATSLFDAKETLEIRLRGPIGELIADKKERREFPFELEIDGTTITVDARVRGTSRIQLCRVPPIRLRFDASASDTVFAGQDKLKLVTHCRRDNERAENNVLDEFAAYRLFNVITPDSYRVRLLRISYQDTGGKSRDEDRSYYGFVIESDDELAVRLDAQLVEPRGVRYDLLEAMHLARVFVFQYLIGNTDYSLVKADGKDHCCHNIDLFDRDGRLVAIPYDFDMSGLVDATYAKPSSVYRHTRVTHRRYVGYCKTSIDSVASALAEINSRRDALMAAVDEVPLVREKEREGRQRFLAEFFERASDQEKLLANFERHCIGKR